ncbi:MAG: MBL fold metallo-hydrolase [Anaerolineaceae bacterium]|jgi:L-ascorbate metabolism protein UlaG (beta-lactamase superfamily)|nr:MBL fold metallo-hydrolase [Anaerolineaceae bacterium]MDI9530630.1 MBL fold metallo-hydrolase [Chloroflexota bacterium]
MEITWYGHSCFRILERGFATVVTDPFDSAVAGYNPLKLKAEIVTVSCNDLGHNNLSAVKGGAFEITGPGEYERGSVFITGIQTTPHSPDSKTLRNTLYVLDYGKLTVLHLGKISSVPSQSLIESLGNINIALVPVGEGGALNASKAAEVISMLEPNIVIPMHYETPHSKLGLDPLSKFLKEMGITTLETMETYKVASNTAFPEEETHVIALDPKLASL